MSDVAGDSQILGPVTILEPELVAEPVAEPVAEQETAPPPRRYPKRKAADDAIQKIKFVREWEGASESSSLFKTVANQIDAELANESLAADEMVEVCDDAEDMDDTVTVNSQDTTKDRSEDESGYESSFIDDEEQDDSCSGSDDDTEWQAEKRVKFESASSESEDTESSGEEDDTECLEAEEGVSVETQPLDIMESDASFFPPPIDFEQDVGQQNYSREEADLADMTWYL